jgi:hypothetical protein
MAAAVRPETRELEQRHYQLGRASNAAHLLIELESVLTSSGGASVCASAHNETTTRKGMCR